MVGRGDTQILFFLCGIEHVEFDFGTHREIGGKLFTGFLPEQFFRLFALERFYHMDILSQYDNIVNETFLCPFLFSKEKNEKKSAPATSRLSGRSALLLRGLALGMLRGQILFDENDFSVPRK